MDFNRHQEAIGEIPSFFSYLSPRFIFGIDIAYGLIFSLMPYMLELACVLALIVEDWIDFAIIAAILLCNGYLGFHEEMKAKASLDELTNTMEQKICVLRDGRAEQLLTRLLVPGDVILVVGGCSVPADIEWLEGDVLSVDTAALTGEPLPRKYPSEEYGNSIMCGSTVCAGEAYCIVRKTGMETEIGSSQADIMRDKTTTNISFFEERVLLALKVIIFISLVDVIIIFLVQGLGRREFHTTAKIHKLVSTCLSIIIAAVPVALPLVLQVTMALGAGKMARDFNAVVTSLPALQDISSMSILCSDKTGTLTTAKITIHAASVWCCEGFTREDVALYGALASSRDKADDPIDRAVIRHFDKLLGGSVSGSLVRAEDGAHSVLNGPSGAELVREYVKTRSVGFNPIYKRVVWEYSHAVHGVVTVAKGLPAKIVNTADGGVDDAADQWAVEHEASLAAQVGQVDLDFSKAGYKTLGIAVKLGKDAPFRFVGILPMLDPPRHDTKPTVAALVAAGVRVKMVTGDHLNIARETARLVGLGVNMFAGRELREGLVHTRDEMVWAADGFAQVLPSDKREVVLCLRKAHHAVVGMTGDGVNDAPALSAAQCGVAVDDATDAAKNAAAIILTSPGLSAIYSAVVESRRIFRKLKAYVTYRFAATIQIVIVLTLLIYISNCPINSLYIILLALLNDLTMLPIAYDNQQASVRPEAPDVAQMIQLSAMLGVLETCFTLLWAYGASHTGIFVDDFNIGASCSDKVQAGIWVQMFVATELLIFSARAPQYLWNSILPAPALVVSVLAGCVLVSVLAGAIPFFGALHAQDVLLIWVYDLCCLVIVDAVKVQYLILRKEFIEVLPDAETSVAAAEKDQASDVEMAAEKRRTKGQLEGPEERKESTDELESRGALGGGAGAGAGAGQFIRVSRSRSSVVNFDKWLATKLAAASEAKDSHPLLLDAGAAAEAAAGAGAEGATEASRIPSTTYQRITTPGDETAAAQLSARISVKRQPSTVAIVAAARRRHSAPDLREDISSTTAAARVQSGPPGLFVMPEGSLDSGAIVVPQNYAMQGSSIGLRGMAPRGSDLRPYTPASLSRASRHA